MNLPLSQNDQRICESVVDRRGFLKSGFFATIACLAPGPVFAATHCFRSPERCLSLYNSHTGESLKVVYWAQGQYLSEALDEINHILRDRRTGEIKPIHTRLLDLLYAIHTAIETSFAFHVICGYRSPATNTMLRKRSKRVAKNSLHMQGKAVDIRLPGCDPKALRRVAKDLKGGGVGYYPGPKFVHVDIGPLRYW